MEDLHRKHLAKGRGEVRKKKYAVSDEAWIKTVLGRGAYGTLATVHNGQPFITPLLYVYIEEDQAIYFHGAQTGRTRANLHHHAECAFNVSEFGRILTHRVASKFNVEYRSVTVFGKARLMENTQAATRILEKLLRKYARELQPGRDYDTIQPEEMKTTSVHKLEIEEWTGKQQVDDEEYTDRLTYPTSLAP